MYEDRKERAKEAVHCAQRALDSARHAVKCYTWAETASPDSAKDLVAAGDRLYDDAVLLLGAAE